MHQLSQPAASSSEVATMVSHIKMTIILAYKEDVSSLEAALREEGFAPQTQREVLARTPHRQLGAAPHAAVVLRRRVSARADAEAQRHAPR